MGSWPLALVVHATGVNRTHYQGPQGPWGAYYCDLKQDVDATMINSCGQC